MYIHVGGSFISQVLTQAGWIVCVSLCSAGIGSVINLQLPGEHAKCGPGLVSSGFTYQPEELMRHGGEGERREKGRGEGKREGRGGEREGGGGEGEGERKGEREESRERERGSW